MNVRYELTKKLGPKVLMKTLEGLKDKQNF